MSNPEEAYVSELARYFADDTSSEMSYRTPFQQYLETIFPKSEKFHIQHDAKSVSGNKPDFIVLRDGVPLLYIEVKKIGEDLNKIEKSSQAARYFGYTNLIISDYAEFRFFRNGEPYDQPISLATVHKLSRTLEVHPGNGERLRRTIRDFTAGQKEPIKSGKHLAKIMGGKGQRIRDNVIAFLGSETSDKDELIRMMRFIKTHLIENFTDADFADMYAQTLVYGLFAARYNDESLDTFSRQEARDLIPATNPFLKSFFDHIAGQSFPKRLELIVNELCEVFTHADVRTLMEQYFKQNDLFGEMHESPDPVIHFYEDFLREYNPEKKMEMGVFYTPLPVVRFIVRGIDALLKREFGIGKGLADNSKISVEIESTDIKGKKRKTNKDVHRVQLLDVATGTGTFLNETVLNIYDSMKENQGRWGAYVHEDLLPRLHGFELMMASYTIAHLKIAMTLKQTGVDKVHSRLGVYLSNTLDEAHEVPLIESLFGVVNSIAEESKLASRVKSETPIMVVMGNPPYSGISQNKHYIGNDVYKVEPGGEEKLDERKHWLDDDYVKFIRFAESMIEKNGDGVIGMITAHGYLDNATFRGMRWHLRKTFDSIYIVDLHGNANKKEVAPDGSEDKNVFDIKTGVSIIFGVKKQSKHETDKPPATIFRADLYGTRASKFRALNALNIATIDWITLPAETETWKLEGEGSEEYKQGFSISELFPKNTTGIVTMGDSFIIDENKETLSNRVDEFLDTDITEAVLKAKYGLGKNYAKWVVENKRAIENNPSKIVPIAYKPFDTRFTYFDNKLVWRPRTDTMQHFVDVENVGLVAMRQATDDSDFNHVLVSKYMVDNRFMYSGKGTTIEMPLYLFENGEKVANLSREIVAKIENVVGKTQPENVLDYVYAFLYSPTYRAKYKDFLKSDFPRVPYPTDKQLFWKLVTFGSQLRAIHLLDDPVVKVPITTFPLEGSNMIENLSHAENRVYINATQYFGGVSDSVWNFYVGGYRPAEKFLKDRKGRKLTTAEFENYEQIIVALEETDRIMKEIDLMATK